MQRRVAQLIAAVVVFAALAVTLSAHGSSPAAGTRALPALRGVSASMDGTTGTVVIEATEPVSYVTSRPDPLTLFVDLRNVTVEGGTTGPIPGAVPPVTSVHVESATASDGAALARIRVQLSPRARHTVRASRNLIYVEVVAPDGVPAPEVAPEPVVAPPAPVMLPSAPAVEVVYGNVAMPAPMGIAAVAALQTPVTTTTTSQAPRFTGHPITLDFQGADLRAVLRTFAEISGLNVVIDPTIAGQVDVALRDVPWDQALDIILRANKLGYAVDGTVVRIAPLTVLADEAAQRQELTDAQALSGELEVLTRALSYAKASEMTTLLTQSALSARGQVQVDARTNTLIVRDLPDRLAAAAELIATLDRPQPQVEIEARIVQTSRDFARALGIQWGGSANANSQYGNTLPLAFPNTAAIDGGVDLGAAAPNTGIGLSLGSVNGAVNLDVQLSALEESGNGRILSTPRVSTQNNVQAEITQGTQIPIQTVANNTVTVSFKDAALTLRVTPQITVANTVIMRIELENATADFGRAVNGIPPIDTQRALTSVLVADGETTVIGGIYVSTEAYSQGRTPFLSRVPLLGWLFRNQDVREQSSELLIFITPRITRG